MMVEELSPIDFSWHRVDASVSIAGLQSKGHRVVDDDEKAVEWQGKHLNWIARSVDDVESSNCNIFEETREWSIWQDYNSM